MSYKNKSFKSNYQDDICVSSSDPCQSRVLCRWLSCDQNWTRVYEAKRTCPITAIVPWDGTGTAGTDGLTNTLLELLQMIDGLRDRLRDFESTSSSPRAMFSGHKEKTTRYYLMRWLVSGVKRDSTIRLEKWSGKHRTSVSCLLAHCQRDYYFPPG